MVAGSQIGNKNGEMGRTLFLVTVWGWRGGVVSQEASKGVDHGADQV